MFKFSRNSLTCATGGQVRFQYDIEKVIPFANLIVVLLKIPPDTVCNENVFGVAMNGSIEWQIEKVLPSTDDSPYINIKKYANGLDAYNWSGLRARVHLETGKVVHKQITK